MKKEERTVLELCRFKDAGRERLETLMAEALDYPYILGQLLFNRVGAVAYTVLRDTGLLPRMNREFRRSLQTVYQGGLSQAESFTLMLEKLSPLFEKADFPYALLKGGYLVKRYPEGLRTSNDLDILVNQENISDLAGMLKGAGFSQGYLRGDSFVPAGRAEILSSRINRGETVPFVLRVDLPQMPYCEVDINFSLDFQAKQETDTVRSFLERAEKRIATEAGGLYTLSREDFILHLCAHLYKEATVLNWVEMGRDLSLYKFCDIYLLLTEDLDGPLAHSLAEHIHRFGLQKECTYALSYTRELFSMEDKALDWLLEDIRPKETGFLKEILRPSDGAVFRYDMEFKDWLFCSNRKEYLYEAVNGERCGPGKVHYLQRFERIR